MGRKKNRSIILICMICAICIVAGIGIMFLISRNKPQPEETAKQYFQLLTEKKYEKMYSLLDEASQKKISKESFVKRNQGIYEGIGAADIKITFDERKKSSKDTEKVTYNTKMNINAGQLDFDNQMILIKNEEKEYRIQWDSTLIHPQLQDDYKIKVETVTASRGSILDRNGELLAGMGRVAQVGLVPGKMNSDPEADIQRIAEILDISVDAINQSLEQSWVQADTFVPLKEISETDADRQNQLLEIPGILINTVDERVYPLGASAGHLTGYIRAISAEELEEKEDEGYHSGSVIGKAGLELIFEDRLRAKDGISVHIVDSNGSIQLTIAAKAAENGEDIVVNIDAGLQRKVYEQFGAEPGAAAAMNPRTGEVLALVSAPDYDPNEFIMGMSESRWTELSESADQPLSNRYTATWVPGSTFKSITAAIGVDAGVINPDENLGNVGLAWQKDESWGNYKVTTLTDYGETVNLENALVYSDNIYFARQALAIGADTLTDKFKTMGFDEEVPFEIGLQKSTYDDDGKLDSDIQIADTGYGQGQLLVNPVHMLSMYSLFVNGGNMLKPNLEFGVDSGKVWKEQVVSDAAAEIVKNDLIQVIENPQGTGANARIDGLLMLGKSGTAEMKANQSEEGGVERGWFICETVEEIDKPIAVVGMVENVQGKGGSHYVSEKVRNVIAAYEGR